MGYTWFGGALDEGNAAPEGEEEDEGGGVERAFVDVGDVGEEERGGQQDGVGRGVDGHVDATGMSGG